MKKSIALIVLSLFSLMSLSLLSNVNAYELSDEKNKIISKHIEKSVSEKIENKLMSYSDNDRYELYNNLKNLVFEYQMKIIERNDLSGDRKELIIEKYNSILFLVERTLSENNKPVNNIWDSI